MPTPINKPRHIPTPLEVRAEQNARAERATRETAEQKAQRAAAMKKLDTPATQVIPSAPVGVLAVADTRTERQRYFDEVAPATTPGVRVDFNGKEAKYINSATEEEIGPDEDFVALADETLVGPIKFNGAGNPPDRRQGLLYDGFVPPPRESLGDLNQAEWPLGLSGAPADPWQHQMCLVLQRPATGELFTFATTSQTGRRAVVNLLRHYDRLRISHPDHYPVVRLKLGGFNHRDERIGWVNTPVFAVVGRVPKNTTNIPDTSPAADLNDEIPF